MKYYNTAKIDRKKATYNIIFGERSNGKTYALLKKAIKEYVKTGSKFAYVRRWKEDIKASRAKTLFDGHIKNGEVSSLTKGEYTGICYSVGTYYLCNYDESGKPIYSDGDSIGNVFAISDGEHNKSTSYPDTNLIIFDEFLTRSVYLPDEFVSFMNVVSTIVRRREGIKIYMLGNTVNKHCPYFKEMGLSRIQNQKQGTIDLYHYGSSTLTVAVEYCGANQSQNKEASKYFAFDNPKLSMITGGSWELDIFPHLPIKYKPKDVIHNFFIEFDGSYYQGDIVIKGSDLFIYFHHKTTEIKNPDSDLVYTLEPSHKMNYNRNIFKPATKLGGNILNIIKADKLFYQDNEVGNNINNYFKYCKR